ncbi:restriction endonuclease [Paenibacillus sp. FSL H7-0350]|uniref:5-methylcytosine restriction system specificity protein McrC n=1 Tax=Paenibacillus sp. FSL H7-0350 TaxID=2975345 RepID=UPI0031589B8B
MHRLFERFVLGYFQRKYPNLKAGASHIDWIVDDGFADFLPRMKTDITLRRGEETLIIDTKYYGNTMQKNPQFDKATLISGHLYQIFTYVKNKDTNNTGNVSGVLLYAKTEEEITPDNEYRMSGNRISVKTLDLSGEWEEIRSQLDGIAAMLL